MQDVIVPFEAGAFLVSVAQYIDDLLTHQYNMEPYYKVRKSRGPDRPPDHRPCTAHLRGDCGKGGGVLQRASLLCYAVLALGKEEGLRWRRGFDPAVDGRAAELFEKIPPFDHRGADGCAAPHSTADPPQRSAAPGPPHGRDAPRIPLHSMKPPSKRYLRGRQRNSSKSSRTGSGRKSSTTILVSPTARARSPSRITGRVIPRSTH